MDKRLTLHGKVIRRKYDYHQKTSLVFVCDDRGEMIALPTDEVSRDRLGIGDTTPATIVVEVLNQPTTKHLNTDDKIMSLDCEPSMFGWLTRAERKAWYKDTRLQFSVVKPIAEDGFLLYGGQNFCINETKFQQVETGDCIPAKLTLVLEEN